MSVVQHHKKRFTQPPPPFLTCFSLALLVPQQQKHRHFKPATVETESEFWYRTRMLSPVRGTSEKQAVRRNDINLTALDSPKFGCFGL
jgi:hypothetical protein